MNQPSTVACASPKCVPVEWVPIQSARETQRYGAARFILFLALCAAPLALGAVELWAWPALTLLALAGLVFWGVSVCLRGAVRIYWSPLYAMGTLVLTLGLIQFFAGLTPDRIATRDALILLATDFVLFFLARQLFTEQSPDTYSQFARIVAIYAFVLALFAIFQVFSSHGLIYWKIKPARGNVFGPYVNRNDYAGLMELLIPIAGAYAFTRLMGDWRRLLATFGVVIAVASLLLSGSRGGMVAMLAETIIFGFIAFHLKLGKRLAYAMLATALALIAGIGLSMWMNPGYVSKRMASIVNFSKAPELTLGQRLLVTRDTLRMAGEHPWLGTGLGSFMIAFPRYQSFPDSAIWEHAHDDYAEALAETGIVGGLLLLAGLWFFFHEAFGRLRERAQSSSGWVQIGCALGCCGLLVHSFVDFNLHIPANAAWFSVCLGLATVPVRGFASGNAR